MKIGVFDSGYGGLTILSKIRRHLPSYDYIYLGDNARAPYGSRSFDVIYRYTLQAVRHLEQMGCRLIILACNTASAKALRTIQQHDIDPNRLRVLGVIRPTVEAVPDCRHIGVLATQGTIQSMSYVLELQKQFALQHPISITQQACPMWVPLIESNEHHSAGADFFVDKYLSLLFHQNPHIETLILACTHYPLLLPQIRQWLGARDVRIIAQGDIVANSLATYLERHTDIAQDLSQSGTCLYLTTEAADKFADSASIFLQDMVQAHHVELAEDMDRY